MLSAELIGQAFLLDNNKEYIIVSTYDIDNNIYAFMINGINTKDAMFAKIILNDSEIYVEEVHDSLITKKIIEIIKSKNQ